MPIETSVAVCGNCGAQLDPVGGRSTLKCGYCGLTTMIGSAGANVVSGAVASIERTEEAPTGILAELSIGPLAREVGEGARHNKEPSNAIPWVARDRSLWPVRGAASSSYGTAWSPNVLIGPPRVFPRSGDIAGAWAPRPRTSPVEWIEVDYAADVPVSVLRVFETNGAGSTFAVVDLTDGAALVWAARPQNIHGAQVLEIAISPPRVIRKLRVYVINQSWTEIDTVGLVSASPLPPALQSQSNSLIKPSGGRRMGVVLGVAAVAAIAVAAAVAGHSSPAHVPTGIVDLDWHANVTAYRGSSGAVLTVRCSSGGEPGSVWGSDVYSDDSSVCSAAVHAGRITLAAGGVVSVELRPGQDHYDGSTRNGIASQSYGRWSGSFAFR